MDSDEGPLKDFPAGMCPFSSQQKGCVVASLMQKWLEQKQNEKTPLDMEVAGDTPKTSPESRTGHRQRLRARETLSEIL
jgi:hypothetical protein